MSIGQKKSKGTLPLVRLSAINPFLVELERRGCNTKQLLTNLELPATVPASPDHFVALAIMYELVERTAAVANDPYFAFGIGASLDVRDWDPFRKAAETAATVGDLLTNFVVDSAEHAATGFELRIESRRATFAMERPFEPAIRPAQNDAFYAGLMSGLLRTACGEAFDRYKVLTRVSDPAVLPQGDAIGRVAQTDRRGARISFPTAWLREPFGIKGELEQCGEHKALGGSLFDTMSMALAPHLHDESLTADKAARICGFNRRRLSDLLRQNGSSIAREIASLRARAAIKRLVDSDDPIADIGCDVGYTNPAVFARAFKNWTGKSPTEYRRNQRN